MSVDIDRVRQRAEYVRRQVAALRAVPLRMQRAAFVVDPYVPSAVRYQLQTSIEALIDLAYHHSAKLAQHAPQDARDAFVTMAQQGILDVANLPRYHAMLRFRNRVVHGDLDVDNGTLYHMISGQDLQDLESVLAQFETAAGA
ncbi:MAG TPA: HepT-like ribonuclease domain-containing protein [Bacillota bacterium]|nr:HepT-like ribonuclease domain-containing protein [Bacillota bacterium]